MFSSVKMGCFFFYSYFLLQFPRNMTVHREYKTQAWLHSYFKQLGKCTQIITVYIYFTASIGLTVSHKAYTVQILGRRINIWHWSRWLTQKTPNERDEWTVFYKSASVLKNGKKINFFLKKEAVKKQKMTYPDWELWGLLAQNLV